MAKKKSVPVTVDLEVEEIEQSESIRIDVENLDPEDDNIEILGKNQKYSLTMYLDPKCDGKHFDRFIKSVERMIRGNDDYKLWLESLRDLDCLSADAFFTNISSQDAEIQLHHYPFNLYTICAAVTNAMLEAEEKVSTFIVSDKVMQLHFANNIGLVPLSVTMHEIAHLNRLKFLKRQIFGSWEKFYETYKPFLTEYDHTIVKDLIARKFLTREDSGVKELTYQNTHNTDEEE